MKELLTMNKIQSRKKFVKELIQRQFFTPEDEQTLQNMRTDQLAFMVQNARLIANVWSPEARAAAAEARQRRRKGGISHAHWQRMHRTLTKAGWSKNKESPSPSLDAHYSHHQSARVLGVNRQTGEFDVWKHGKHIHSGKGSSGLHSYLASTQRNKK